MKVKHIVQLLFTFWIIWSILAAIETRLEVFTGRVEDTTFIEWFMLLGLVTLFFIIMKETIKFLVYNWDKKLF